MAEEETSDLSLLTATIVAAYVASNKLSATDLTALIGSTYQALSGAQSPPPPEAASTPKPDKAAVKKSLHADHLTSFIDGRQYKSLKRHLGSNGMTPAQYRETYGLPSDYPMVAPSYSARRSALARSLGLGRKASPQAAAKPAAQPAKGRGRPKAIKPQDETFN